MRDAWQTSYQFLQNERTPGGHWLGELSTSALSTATAISALAQLRKSDDNLGRVGDERIGVAIRRALAWLHQQQNDDGGFGDTNRSHSNIATTLLVLAAWELAGQIGERPFPADGSESMTATDRGTPSQPLSAARQYVEEQGSWQGLRRRYGKDKTFVVPILSNCALAGLVAWRDVPPLPFEAAWLPQDWYRWARMPVVSYAVPALVSIGQARFHFAPPRNPLLRALRRRAIAPTLRVLLSMQPASGGYLEATPLTSFVLMSLAAAGNGKSQVAQNCLRFLMEHQLPDGSWPIDTNLATWVTSLSITAVSRLQPPNPAADQPLVDSKSIRWLLDCQHRKRHPFTGANPGGWGWTDLSGAVPDADDTPAALLALHAIDWQHAQGLERLQHQAHVAVAAGLSWLVRLQNRDGGWPTFCRGWGKLPFDRSGTDLTAHALRAFHAWLPHWESLHTAALGHLPSRRAMHVAIRRGLTFLSRTQQPDGSWNPLWFGNQDRLPLEDNPIYGTGKVLAAYGQLRLSDGLCARRGIQYLQRAQNEDGGWGGGPSVRYNQSFPPAPPDGGFRKHHPNTPFVENQQVQPAIGSANSTIEETAVALEGLLMCGGQLQPDATIMQALRWLTQAVQDGNLNCSWPIGFYFAKLWYHERLYPAIFSISALGLGIRACEQAAARD